MMDSSCLKFLLWMVLKKKDYMNIWLYTFAGHRNKSSLILKQILPNKIM
jgi:hypothetical protein